MGFIATVLLLTRYLSRRKQSFLTPRQILGAVAIVALPVFLIALERAKVLGLNAARVFGFQVPERYTGHADAAAHV